MAALPAFVLVTGASAGANQDNEWRYWRDYRERPYLTEYVPLKTVPATPKRNYTPAPKGKHKAGESAGYDYAPLPKKRKKVYSGPAYDDHHDSRDGRDRHYAGYDRDAGYHEDHANGRGFGRLFPDAAEDLRHDRRGPSFRALRALGRSMVEEGPRDHPSGDSEMPAGYTIFGQFIDHDITFETRTDLGREISGDHLLENARTPDLDLDSVYGGGPARTPHLYRLPYIRVGRLVSDHSGAPRHDLFRTRYSRRDGPQGGGAVALLGDPRNDENIIISQLHAAFVAFHNRTADILIERDHGHYRADYCRGYHCSTHELAEALPDEVKKEVFETARDHVIHFYHRLILDDFLPRVIGPNHLTNILKNGRDFYFPAGFRKGEDHLEDPYIPIEFSFVFRYGHSQVRDSYILREGVRFDLLTDGRGGQPRAFEPVTPRYLLDWRYFFEISNELPRGFNFARRIDPELVKGLHELSFSGAVGQGEVESLAARNLARSKALHIPSGQTIAEIVLPRLEERGLLGHSENDGRPYRGGKQWRQFLLPPDDRTKHFLRHADTPLWYYVLQEAEVFGSPTGLHALPAHGPEGLRYSARRDDVHGYRGGFRRASFDRRRDYPSRDDYGHDGGHRLGPVGSTIVGEVLIGLMEHYAEQTGKGLDYEPEIKGSLSELIVPKYGKGPKKRYLMRNFLIDAGVADEIY